MKIKSILIFFLFAQYVTSCDNNSYRNSDIDSLEAIDEETLRELKLESNLWFNSWKNDLEPNSFIKTFKKEFKRDCDTVSDSFLLYNSFARTFSIESKDSSFAIDLFTYSINPDTTNNEDITVSFSVDQKIVIYPLKSPKYRCMILYTGSYENVEDAVWSKNREVVTVLGYNQNEDDTLTPFIWLFDLSKNIQIKYNYKSSFSDVSRSFFEVKYPFIRVE